MAEEVRRFRSLNGHGKIRQLGSAPDSSEVRKLPPKAVQFHVRSRSISPSVNSRSQSADSSGDQSRALHPSHEPHSKAATTGWTAFYLRKGTLVCFAVCYIVMLIALAVLAYVDGSRHGLLAAQDSQHYLWTYGPTAILAVIAALWGQVEHRTKQALPWTILRDDSSADSSALLMDYINPSQPEALYRALRSSHWPVVLVVASSWIIKLLTIASTGLLVLTDTSLVQDCRLYTPNNFDNTTFNTSNIGSMPVLAALAVRNGSIPYPPGTSRDMAFTIPRTIGINPDVKQFDVEAPVKTFSAGLNCELATISSHDTFCRDRRCHGYSMHIDMDSPSCQIRNLTYTIGCDGGSAGPLTCTVGDMRPVQCSSTTDETQPQRLLITVARVFQNVSGYGQTLRIVSNETTSLLCLPTYNISSALVRVDHQGNLLDVTTHPNELRQAFSGWDILDGLHMSADATGSVLGLSYGYDVESSDKWASMWVLYRAWVNSTLTTEDMNDVNLLRATSNEFFGMVSAQLAQRYLVNTTDTNVEGVCYASEPRLRIRGLSFYLMVALLILLTVSVILLVFLAPRNATIHDPGSIGSVILIMAENQSLFCRLSGTAVPGTTSPHSPLLEAPRQNIAETLKWNLPKDSQFVQASWLRSQGDSNITKDQERARLEWWRPLSSKTMLKALTVVALFLMVLTLELLLWNSRSNHGLHSVDPQGYVRFAWVYVPAATMVGVQLLVGMIAFTSILVFPYYNLRVRSFSTRADLLRDYASKTAVQSLCTSAVNRHIPVLFITLAMFLTPLLTIVVGGLYTAQIANVQHKVSLETISQFNTTFDANDLVWSDQWARATRDIGLLFTQNISYPAWTSNELAFPEFRLQVLPAIDTVLQKHGHRLENTSANGPAIQGNISANVPAVRADLSCKDVTVRGARAFFGGTYLNDTAYAKISNFTALRAIDCGGSWPTVNGSPFGFFDQGLKGIFCGAYGIDDQHWRAFTCNGSLQMLDVNVVLDSSTFSVLDALTDEASVRVVSKHSIRSQFAMDFPAEMIPSIYGTATYSNNFPNFFDPSFQAIIYSVSPTIESPNDFPIQDYMTDDGFGRLVNSLNHVYRTVQAQSANIALRVPLNSSALFAPPAQIDATLTTSNGYRLVQSPISTRILDGLLAAIAICVAISAWLMNTGQVLLRNPASIAGAASLVTESTVLLRAATMSEGDSGSEATGRAERIKKDWNGMHFSMGWWTTGSIDLDEKGRRRFGIDIGQAERD